MCASLALLIMACMMMMLSRALAALSLPNTPSDPSTAAAGSTRKHANGGGEAGKRKSATDGSYGMSEAARRGDGAEKCAPNDDGSKCAINVRDLCADGAVHVLTRTDVSCKANPKRRNRALFPSETSARLGKRSGNASSPLATGCFIHVEPQEASCKHLTKRCWCLLVDGVLRRRCIQALTKRPAPSTTAFVSSQTFRSGPQTFRSTVPMTSTGQRL